MIDKELSDGFSLGFTSDGIEKLSLIKDGQIEFFNFFKAY